MNMEIVLLEEIMYCISVLLNKGVFAFLFQMLIGADPAKDQYDQEQVETSTIQHLIHEYLIHNCYTETALAFGKHLLLDVDMDLLQRKEIKEYILLGTYN